MSRIIVLGAGVLGASTAYHLARAGADVTVLEAAGPASGTSSATFSIDVTHLKTPHDYYLLNRQGSDGHLALAAELEGLPWRHPAPLVQWSDTDEGHQALRERALRVREWGHTCEFAPATALRDLAPAADPASCTADEIVVHERAAWYDAPRFVRALLDGAARLGATVHYGVRATGLLRSAEGRVTGVRAGERTWTADKVVNCAGPYADRIAALADARLPMERIPGLVGESTPVPEAGLGAILAAPGVDLRPAPDARVVSISWPVDALLADGTTDLTSLAADLHGRGEKVLPALTAARSAGARVGLRPVPLDGLPLAGELPSAPGLYHLVSHSAVNLAPALGRLAAQELTTGTPTPELSPYRPDRATDSPVRDESLQVMSGHAAR
ncbi:NAD(P)/FAD-dependent oxidoreductase [Streptomyces sp. SDT5-1]|uniref:NAD(P)/FAD-dependent oxidoreductase n=1 Tax=Streptomyces sp. SDT5-1 TaxID=3406418 RepID=UPI003FD58152